MVVDSSARPAEPGPASADPRDLEVQQAIVADIVRAEAPILLGAAVVALIVQLVGGMAEPTRMFAPAVGILAAVIGFRAVARGYHAFSAWVLFGGVIAAVMGGMVLNGGLAAPSAALMYFILALGAWLFGQRTSRWLAVGVLGWAVLVAALTLGDVLPTVNEPPVLYRLGIMAVTLLLVWSAVAIPQRRLRLALRQAFVREREAAEAEKRRREADLAFATVFDQTTHLMCLVSPVGRLSGINRTALDFLGVGTADAVVGRPFDELPWWPEAERGAVREALARAAAERVPVRLRTRKCDHSGKEHIIDFSVSPLRSEDGELRMLIAESRDITDWIEAEQRLGRTQRLELVGQLAGGVAHDFNNVLMAILSSAETLKADLLSGTAPRDLADRLDTIARASVRAGDLTRRLLTLAHRAPLEKDVLSLGDVIVSTQKLLERTLPPNIALRTRLDARRDLVLANRSAVESTLLNLAVNARDAMPQGGTLWLATDEVTLDPAAVRALRLDLAPGPYVCMSVKDTGSGIAPELHAKVFEPFFTTKADGGGSGLGLASVQRIVTNHGGAVRLESGRDQGTTFFLYFPRAEGAARKTGEVSKPPSFEGLHALLVDDEPILRMTGQRMLQMLGLRCTVAADAEAALAAFTAEGASYDIAMLDVMLPGRSGDALAAELLQLSPKLRVLLVSGFAKDLDASVLATGRAKLLGKPFTLQDLGHALTELVRAES